MTAAIKNEHAPKSEDENARARFFQKRKAEGVKTGIPDLLVCMPNGVAFFIEVKAPKTGVVSSQQDVLHATLRNMGFPVLLATSIETCRYGLQSLGIPLREATGQPVTEPKVRLAKAKTRIVKDAIPW